MLDHAASGGREIVACGPVETRHMRLDVFAQIVAGSANRRFLVAVRARGRVERWAESFRLGEDATKDNASAIESIQLGGGQARERDVELDVVIAIRERGTRRGRRS